MADMFQPGRSRGKGPSRASSRTAAKMSRAARKRAAASAPKAKVNPRVLLLALLLSVASAAAVALFSFPQFSSFRSTSAALSDNRAQIADLEVRIEEAAVGGDADLADLYGRVQQMEDAFPPSPSREELTVAVVQLADSLGVQVQRLDPAGDPPGEDLARYRFSARFAGSYGALMNLLDGLDRIGPVVTFNGGQMAVQGDMFVVSTTLDFWYVKFPRLTEPGAPAVQVPVLPPPSDAGSGVPSDDGTAGGGTSGDGLAGEADLSDVTPDVDGDGSSGISD